MPTLPIAISPANGPTLRRPSARRLGVPRKSHPTFADVLALVGRQSWVQLTFCVSSRKVDTVKVPREFVECLTETLCYAA